MSERFDILQNLLRDLSGGSRDYVTHNMELAQGYAWGFQDCKMMYVSENVRISSRDVLDAQQFAYEYGIHIARYTREERHSHTNIQYAYGAWCDGLTDERKWS